MFTYLFKKDNKLLVLRVVISCGSMYIGLVPRKQLQQVYATDQVCLSVGCTSSLWGVQSLYCHRHNQLVDKLIFSKNRIIFLLRDKLSPDFHHGFFQVWGNVDQQQTHNNTDTFILLLMLTLTTHWHSHWHLHWPTITLTLTMTHLQWLTLICYHSHVHLEELPRRAP